VLNLSTSPATLPADAETPHDAAITLDDVSFRYGERVALNRVSLAVRYGAIAGLLGPNGSGKSTLLSLLAGRRSASAGLVRILGGTPNAATRARIGVVFQEPSLDPMMTVSETMRLHARLFGIPRRQASSAIDSMLERVGLRDRQQAFTSTLSGGMKRRLELARALVTKPEVILLDEPTLALDPDSRQAVWAHLLEVNAQGATLLLATNDVHEAERYCHDVALLDHGAIVAHAAPTELKRDLRADAVRIEWRDDPSELMIALEAQPGVGHVRLVGRTTHVTVDDASPFLARIFQQWGAAITGVHIEPSTLEDVYFQLVGRGISNDHEADA
jgi:ABC-type multidrug transport system ATPase subunit